MTFGAYKQKVVKVIIPAVISAIPSDKKTPLAPIIEERIMHKGINNITFLKQARKIDIFA